MDKIKAQTPLLDDLIGVITKYYPYAEFAVRSVYNQCKSIDETIVSCEICSTMNTYLKHVSVDDIVKLSKVIND